MEPVESVYGGRFFRNRHKLAWRGQIICSSIKKFFVPKTAIDVGCAIGDLVLGFVQSEIDGYGLEGSGDAIPYLLCERERVVLHDLRLPILSLPINFPSQFDVVTCFEVAEHLDFEHADLFVWNLQSLAKRWIIMSAAPPGQGGHSHVNCQPPEYWIFRMEMADFQVRSDLKNLLKEEWEPWKKKDGIRAFYDNLLVFEKMREV